MKFIFVNKVVMFLELRLYKWISLCRNYFTLLKDWLQTFRVLSGALYKKKRVNCALFNRLSALICSSLFTGTRLKSSRASTVNSSLVDTPIIWTAAKSQPIDGKPTSANPALHFNPGFSLFCLKAFSWINFSLLLDHPIINFVVKKN